MPGRPWSPQAAEPGSPVALARSAALSAHAAMVAALRDSQMSVGTVELIETRLSSLLRVGNRVYKLKKPEQLEFVDFSTLRARHQACEHELRLNRRTAPRLYEAVVAVRQTPDGPRLGGLGQGDPGTGAVIDWAVQMRRFDDHQRLDRLAEAGQLTGPMMDRLAEAVTRFHGQLHPAPPGFGRAEASRHWPRENLFALGDLLRTQPGVDPARLAQIEALQQWTEARGAALAGLMDRRCRAGHVREVHGDLHLANIVWLDNAPLLFDALAFNETLRHTDTAGDLAFTFMDLLAHGQPRLAWRFLSAALALSGDHAVLPLLIWWAVYRATARATAAWTAAVHAAPPCPQPAGQGGGPAPPADQRSALALQGPQALAQRYLDLALALAGLSPQPIAPRPPFLALTVGLPGAGKSAVAEVLAERLGAVRLSADQERRRLFGASLAARESADAAGADISRLTDQRLATLAEGALAAGVSVLIDASSLRLDQREALRQTAARCQASFKLLLCEAPVPTLRARLALHAASVPDADHALQARLTQQLASAEWPAGDELAEVLHLATDGPLSALVARLEAMAVSL